MPAYGMGTTASATEIPLARIQEMKSQGLTNNQIIQSFQRQGFSSTQIFDALSQSAVQPAATMAPPPLLSPAPVASPYPAASTMALNSTSAPGRHMEPPPMAPPPMMRSSSGFESASDTEEMIETIIDEKWNDMVADINKVIAWKESTEARITKLEQQMNDLKDQFDKLHQAIVGKIGEYDQHVLEIGADVKAMEKVFSKVLPVFTDNVAELSRITDTMRRGPGAQTPAPGLSPVARR